MRRVGDGIGFECHLGEPECTRSLPDDVQVAALRRDRRRRPPGLP